MLCGLSDPLIATKINRQRSISFDSVDSVKYLFHNLNLTTSPVLKAQMEDGSFRRVSLSPKMDTDLADITSNNPFLSPKISELTYRFDIEDGEGYRYSNFLYTDNEGKKKVTGTNFYNMVINTLYTKEEKNDDTTSQFASLVKLGGKQWVIDAIHEFDPRIESIEALPDGLYLKLTGCRELLPICMSGDGVRHMVSILSLMASEDINVFAIDEIDNGMHYSAHKLMWKTILKFIQQRNIQVFITTHNMDCLLGLLNTMEEFTEFRSMANVYNISKTKANGFQSYRYSYNELKEAIEREIEIRK